VDSEPYAFPTCRGGATVDNAADLALCRDHRQLLLDDPGEFRRLWGALDPRPRPPAMPLHIPGNPQAPMPPARGADGS
jgi:hypothetical protein